MNCPLLSGCRTSLVQLYRCGWGLGSGMGFETCFGIHMDTELEHGLRWTSFGNRCRMGV